MKKALIIGSTGLVGGHCLQLLLDSTEFSEVVALTRTPLAIKHPKLKNVVVNFDDVTSWQDFTKTDVLVSAMGTTIGKAGSQKAFRKVDFDYPLAIAEMCKKNGVTTHALVSALGADSRSKVFYNQVKGELENAIFSLEFKKNIIVQPSLLLGKRGESRPMEAIAQTVIGSLNFLFIGPLKKIKAVSAKAVAKALVNAIVTDSSQSNIIIENKDITRFE